ncbi:FtsK/SpoIIIE domain-containing protein [Streptomyces antimicrobicus]|uniref:FtsK domain-containing protein n=1 Tax=Streptomyces antimicrobicus TaxID=2883108 RepID=A0ABS8BA70_9ACTN|nr:FtsK/SpoIIIE domain-containing protein [Streptomyces antimicrobicus]MCB5181499.1 hypothetical protein [Streptomyces antimicrobicus]
MSKKDNQDQDDAARAVGALGGLVIITGFIAAIKDWLGLGWPATVMLIVGVLLALGYGIWKAKGLIRRLMAGDTRSPAPPSQETAVEPAGAPALDVAVHPELTEALVRTGAIARDEVIPLHDVHAQEIPGYGIRYTFLLPKGRTHEEVSKRLGPIASMLGVTRLHLKVEASRRNEREVTIVKLDEPPFSRIFEPPTRKEIKAYKGLALGHEVTGELCGITSLEKTSILVAGMTQTGKTTLINGFITCLLIAYGDEYDLVLLDGKFIGLAPFARIALRYQASDDPAVLEEILDELLAIVHKRYEERKKARLERKPEPKFRPIVFIVDEAADFYADNGAKGRKEAVARVEEKSRQLVSKSLESGVSVIMMTQRPDKDAIPVNVRAQFQCRVCLYVDSEGAAKVALGDSYFTTRSPIHPALLNPEIQGQAVLFARGQSTLIRGFNFPETFMWEVIDETYERRKNRLIAAPESPRKKAIDLMRARQVDFMTTADLAEALNVVEANPIAVGKTVSKLLGVAPHKRSGGVRGYRLADLTAAAMSDS